MGGSKKGNKTKPRIKIGDYVLLPYGLYYVRDECCMVRIWGEGELYNYMYYKDMRKLDYKILREEK